MIILYEDRSVTRRTAPGGLNPRPLVQQASARITSLSAPLTTESDFLDLGGRGGWGGGGVGGVWGGGEFWYGCASQYFKTYPIHIPGLRKNGPIHILDHPKCWPIHILPFDFLYPFFAGYYTNIILSSCNTKRISSLEKSLSEKYVHIPGCQKNGAFHIGIQKKRSIHILFVEKRGPII